jgi:predicted nucleic acid-binding protein
VPDPILVDTGPLVSCFNPDDQDHRSSLEKMRLLKGRRLVTTLAVVTETLYLLDFSLVNQQKFLQFLSSGVLEVLELTPEDFSTISDLMQKYRDCPMDFGDATLVLLSGRLRTREILTLDHRDFGIYRTPTGHTFEEV